MRGGLGPSQGPSISNQRRALFDGGAFLGQDRGHLAGDRRFDRHLHLHRLEDHHRLTFADGVADLDLNLPDGTGDVRLHGGGHCRRRVGTRRARSSERQALRHRRRHVKGELPVGVAVLGAANAGDARRAREAAGLGREAPRVAGGHERSRRARQRPPGRRRRRAPGSRRSRRPARAPAAQASRIDDDQRAVRPPRPEHGVDLQARAARAAEAGGAAEPLERNQRRRSRRTGSRSRARTPSGASAARDRRADDARREAIERVRRAVRRFGRLAREAIEERRPARADDQRGARAGQQLRQPQLGRRPARRRRRTAAAPAAGGR